jgi:hypothetical protein
MSTPSAANCIVNLGTKSFRNNSGEFPAIVMGLNILDMASKDAFLDEVVEKFKGQRMCSPPQTVNMTVTIAGDMVAAEFRSLWLHRCGRDPILKHFTSLMVLADVLHIQGNQLLDRASLIS